MTQYEPLRQVLSRIRDLAAKKILPVVIFDLDDTLFSTAERDILIIRNFASDHGDAYPDFVEAAENLTERDMTFNAVDALTKAGLPEDSASIQPFEDYWRASFFTDAYAALDLPVRGAVDFVKACYQAGAMIFYLTGRPVSEQDLNDGMGQGTVLAFTNRGFPFWTGRCELMLKKDRHEPDVQYKSRAVDLVATLRGSVVATFDNEPANAAMFLQRLPDAMNFWVKTTWNPNDHASTTGLIQIPDFKGSGHAGKTFTYRYVLGSTEILAQLYPPPKYALSELGFSTYADVIAHYTNDSLEADGLTGVRALVQCVDEQYEVILEGDADLATLEAFGGRHAEIFGPRAAQKAIVGANMLKSLGIWNPMKGYHVNKNPGDDTSKWHLFPPLGLNMIGQRGLLLMHYPPWATLQNGTFQHCMTMNRWNDVLFLAGIPNDELARYRTIIDVNPIAAPGSGESEYENDYLPVMMASAFFTGPDDRDYIRSMLELYLEPPGLSGTKYTLPLLICGSPLYDPQAPDWFKVTYTDILPQDEHGIPQVKVLQAGSFKLRPDSKRETPYLIANHMIAAGVTGRCTGDAGSMPDIRLYEAQDLVAASFLAQYRAEPDLDPREAKKRACRRWFGNDQGTGTPRPPDPGDAERICTLAQVDLFFEPLPEPHPKYSLDEAKKRCANAGTKDDPCCPDIRPKE